MPLSIGIINLVAAPDRKDRRCLTVSIVIRKTASWGSAKPCENVEVSSLSYR